MKKNIIETIRKNTLTNFKGSKPCDYPPSLEVISPSKNYSFQAHFYEKKIDDGITFGNHYFTKIIIFDSVTKEEIGSYLTNNRAIFSSQNGMTTVYNWLELDGKEYLLLSETQYGQSIFDLKEKTLYSFQSKDAHEEIIGHYPSPNGLHLTILLYDGSANYRAVVYDLLNPTVLPYKELFCKNIDNGAYIEKIDCNNGHLNITYSENYFYSPTFVKIEVREVPVEIDWSAQLRCYFQDIHGNEYTCFEKNQAMLTVLVDETVTFPIEGAVNCGIKKYRTENGRKIYTIGGDDMKNKDNVTVLEIEVFEEQIIF